MTKEDFIRGLNEDLVAEWGVPQGERTKVISPY
jgi:hypothetical protein